MSDEECDLLDLADPGDSDCDLRDLADPGDVVGHVLSDELVAAADSASSDDEASESMAQFGDSFSPQLGEAQLDDGVSTDDDDDAASEEDSVSSESRARTPGWLVA